MQGQRSEVTQAVQHTPRQPGVGITTINLPHRSTAARTPSGALDLTAALERVEALRAEQLARDNADYLQPMITNSVNQPIPFAASPVGSQEEKLIGNSRPGTPSVPNKAMFNSPSPIKEPGKIQFQRIESLNSSNAPTGFSGPQFAPQVSNGPQVHSAQNPLLAPTSGLSPQPFYPTP
jgi:hypothetical protein